MIFSKHDFHQFPHIITLSDLLDYSCDWIDKPCYIWHLKMGSSDTVEVENLMTIYLRQIDACFC